MDEETGDSRSATMSPRPQSSDDARDRDSHSESPPDDDMIIITGQSIEDGHKQADLDDDILGRPPASSSGLGADPDASFPSGFVRGDDAPPPPGLRARRNALLS